MKKKWMSLGVGVGLLLLAIMIGSSALAEPASTSMIGGGDVYATEWYMQPWVWIVSGGVFILLFTIIISREDQDA